MNTDYLNHQETRITFAATLERSTIEEARKVYHFESADFRHHLKQLEKMGLVKVSRQYIIPVRTPQSFIYAYTDVEWEDCKNLSEEECKTIAREFLRNNKHRGLEDFLSS